MIFKCKMCGGDIEKINNGIGKCLYCKSTMTLPQIDNEKLLNLYNRANDLRLNNEFDKAYEIYESILKINNEEIEAHWGLLLCKYGVEYVDDPRTKLKIPTCHRTKLESILSDNDYLFIKERAYGESLELYEKEAKQINNIQKRILDISSKESPYDIFICYKETDSNGERTKESVLSEEIYEKLTDLNYKVFFARITLEEKLGEEYEPYIFNALTSSKVMLVVGTSSDNLESVWVKNEWSRYLELMSSDKTKSLVPVYSEMDAYKLPVEFSMFQAQNMDKVGAMQDLIRGIKKIVEASKNNTSLDDETFKKFQEVLDDSTKIGDDKYEITEVKEKIPVWYLLVVLGIIVGISFIKFILVADNNLLGILYKHIYRDTYGFGQDVPLIKSFVIAFHIIHLISLCVVGIMKILSRKTYKLGNKILFLLIISEFIPIIILLFNNVVLNIIGFLLILVEVVLLLINPKWILDASSKVIVDKEQKQRLEIKNKQIKENFILKEQPLIKIKYIIIGFIIFIFVYGLITFILFFLPNGNKRNSSIPQIKIIATKLNIRNNYGEKVSFARRGEYYDILSIRYDELYQDERCLYYVKIKTNDNITGYICAQFDTKKYIKILGNTNEQEIDYTKTNIKIITDYVNVREYFSQYYDRVGIVFKDEVYEVYDQEANWYKIKTRDGKYGWIVSSQGGEKYIEVISPTS